MRLLTFFVLVFAGISAFGQKATVSGTVTDEKGKSLPRATVFNKNDRREAISCDDEGRYSLEVTAGTVNIVYSFTGSKPVEITFDAAPGEQIFKDAKIKLGTDIGQADIITEGDRTKPLTRLEPKVYSRIPSTRGTIEDLLLQAPVNFTSELSSSYNVRGGNFDENLVYVNGIQVYRPFLVRAGQQEGLSFPNPDMVNNIYFSAGGFEAKYGDRMSSVLDIQYRTPTEYAGSVTASMLGTSLQFEGINKKGNFTHNSGFRYRNNSYVIGSLDEQGDYNPNYLDFQTFMTWKKSAYSQWSYNFLGNVSRNRYNFIPQTRETDVGNINEALRLTVFFNGQERTGFDTYFGAFSAARATENSRMQFIASAFQTFEFETFDILGAYSLDELERDLGSDEFGEVLTNRGVGAFLDHARNELEATVLNFTHTGFSILPNDNVLEWGVKYQYENIYDKLSEWNYVDSAGFSSPHPQDSIGYQVPSLQPDQQIILRDVIKGENDVVSSRVTAYVQNTWSAETEEGHEWNFNVGLRGNYWSFNNEFVGGPRAHMSYKPRWIKYESADGDTLIRRDIIFNLAGGLYYQPAFYREMRGITGEVNPDIQAQRSIHVVAGIDYLFEAFNRPFKLVTEVYYKDYSNLIPYEVENVRLRYYGENLANGYATGADVMLNGEFIKGIQSWLRVSFLKTEEDLTNDFYYERFNDEGNLIIPGFTLNDDAVDSNLVEPGFIPRPTDQRLSFSMLFQDEMKRWPEYKVLVSIFYGTGLPYGPPSFERYLDVLRTSAYRRVDIGFSRELVVKPAEERNKFKWMKEGYVALEVFNILGVNNTISQTWIEDVNGRQYAIPNFLTGRRLNLKVAFKF
ncbi:MAG: TonB-dependent receptor [Flavobacteriales bacterium]|nr:TonB-dependent receptor [Flavobacteriales bacterium]